MLSEKKHRDPHTDEQEPSADYWQARVDSLEEIVCLLLMENQAIRSQQAARE